MKSGRILVIGAGGNVGSELTAALRKQRGTDYVVAADPDYVAEGFGYFAAGSDVMGGYVGAVSGGPWEDGPRESLDILNRRELSSLVDRYQITEIYMLAAISFARAENEPRRAWQFNTESLLAVLDLARERSPMKVFWPSSVAVFGPGAPRYRCPQESALRPATVYGISKAAGENWCRHYYDRYGVDVRSLRYPGLVSYQDAGLAMAGNNGAETLPVDTPNGAAMLRADSELPMMYISDMARATMELMEASAADLTIRQSYNIAAGSMTLVSLLEAMRLYVPGVTLHCEPDYRLAIADRWPASIDDTQARRDFGWKHRYSLGDLTRGMLKHLAARPYSSKF
jgi:nucleoside-diphosphate-sugar epimerase